MKQARKKAALAGLEPLPTLLFFLSMMQNNSFFVYLIVERNVKLNAS